MGRNWIGLFVFVLALLSDIAGAAPVLYYSFESPDTASDSLATDNSGNARNGSLSSSGSGAFAYEAVAPAGISGTQSLHLTDTGTTGNAARLIYNVTTSILNYSTQSWSYWGWHKKDGTQGNDFVLHLGNGDGFGTDNELYVDAGTTGLTLVHYAGASTDVSMTRSLTGTVNDWHSMAITFDASSNTLAFYVDGTLVGTDNTLTMNITQSSASNTAFGGHQSTGNTQRYFNGWLDDVALYDSVLTAQGISALHSGTFTPLSVPEPAALGLIGVAALFLGTRRSSR